MIMLITDRKVLFDGDVPISLEVRAPVVLGAITAPVPVAFRTSCCSLRAASRGADVLRSEGDSRLGSLPKRLVRRIAVTLCP